MADIRAQLTRVREAANDAAANATDRIKDSSERARDGASDLIQTGRDKASEAYDGVRDKTQRAAARANEIVQEHPVLAVAGAVAAGAVIAWMFPKSRKVMKALPGLVTTAGASIVEAAVAARAAAGDRAGNVKSGASHALHNAGAGIEHVVAPVKQTAINAIHAAGEAASKAQESVAAAELPAKASKLADDVATLVSHRIEALSDAIRARLPKS